MHHLVCVCSDSAQRPKSVVGSACCLGITAVHCLHTPTTAAAHSAVRQGGARVCAKGMMLLLLEPDQASPCALLLPCPARTPAYCHPVPWALTVANSSYPRLITSPRECAVHCSAPTQHSALATTTPAAGKEPIGNYWHYSLSSDPPCCCPEPAPTSADHRVSL